MDKPFCVIGRTCGKFGSQYNRRWFATEDEAVTHASKLVSKQGDRRVAFVVEVKQVVTTEPPPRVYVTSQSQFSFDSEVT